MFSALSDSSSATSGDDVPRVPLAIKEEPVEVDLSQLVSRNASTATPAQESTAVPLKRSRSAAPSPELFPTTNPVQPPSYGGEESLPASGVVRLQTQPDLGESLVLEAMQSNAARYQQSLRPRSAPERIAAKRKREKCKMDGAGPVLPSGTASAECADRKSKKAKTTTKQTLPSVPHTVSSAQAAGKEAALRVDVTGDEGRSDGGESGFIEGACITVSALT